MKKDIAGIDDIRLMVRTFYKQVLADPLISPYFEHAVKSNWEQHLEVMDRFWDNVIFFTGTYNGNPLQQHKKMHTFQPLNKEAFQRWLQLFTETVDTLFEGEKAELAKQRALSIATVMQLKILYPEQTLTDFQQEP